MNLISLFKPCDHKAVANNALIASVTSRIQKAIESKKTTEYKRCFEEYHALECVVGNSTPIELRFALLELEIQSDWANFEGIQSTLNVLNFANPTHHQRIASLQKKLNTTRETHNLISEIQNPPEGKKSDWEKSAKVRPNTSCWQQIAIEDWYKQANQLNAVQALDLLYEKIIHQPLELTQLLQWVERFPLLSERITQALADRIVFSKVNENYLCNPDDPTLNRSLLTVINQPMNAQEKEKWERMLKQVDDQLATLSLSSLTRLSTFLTQSPTLQNKVKISLWMKNKTIQSIKFIPFIPTQTPLWTLKEANSIWGYIKKIFSFLKRTEWRGITLPSEAKFSVRVTRVYGTLSS